MHANKRLKSIKYAFKYLVYITKKITLAEE